MHLKFRALSERISVEDAPLLTREQIDMEAEKLTNDVQLLLAECTKDVSTSQRNKLGLPPREKQIIRE